MNLAVDGHRHALVHVISETRKPVVELVDQAAHRGRGHIDLVQARGETLAVPAREDHMRQRGYPALASSAALIFGGDSGKSVIRTPIAALTALPTAASGGTLGTSIITVSIIGRSEATGIR